VRAQLARSLVLAGLDLLRFDRAASRLESVFIQLARSEAQEAAAEQAAAGVQPNPERRPS
jgi:hypothetical protein